MPATTPSAGVTAVDDPSAPDPAWRAGTMSASSQVDGSNLIWEPAAKLRDLFCNVDGKVFEALLVDAINTGRIDASRIRLKTIGENPFPDA